MNEFLLLNQTKASGASFKRLQTTGSVPTSIASIKAVLLDNYLYTYALWTSAGSNFRRLNLDTLVWEGRSADTVGNFTNFALAASNNKVWMLAGNNNGDRTTVAAFNSQTLAWETSAAATFTNTNAGAIGGPDNAVYTLGGSYSWNFQRYDTVTKSGANLTLPSDKPGNGMLSIVGSHGTKIYIYGGTAAGTNNKLASYDVISKTWEDLATAPEPRYDAGSFATIGNTLYTFGGIGPSGVTDKLMSYDILTNTWHELATAPMQLGKVSKCSIASRNGKLYIFEPVSISVWEVII